MPQISTSRRYLLAGLFTLPITGLASSCRGSSVQAPDVLPDVHVPTQQLAELEYKANRLSRPECWREASYLSHITFAPEVGLLYLVSHDRNLISRFARRVEHAADSGMRVYDIAQHGYLGQEGYFAVTMFAVSSKGLAQQLHTFADLLAQYPEPHH